MHDRDAAGNEFFKCDFCGKPWADDRPMVEGHQGSLVCSACLATAYTEIVHLGAVPAAEVRTCLMCLEQVTDRACWESPLKAGAFICRRCIKQSAGVLEHDDEYDWKRPAATGAGPPEPADTE